MKKLTEHFTDKELACRCCGEHKFPALFLEKLEILRVEFADIMTVNSSCRCKKHNTEVGGANGSYHRLDHKLTKSSETQYGTCAIDISTKNWSKKKEVVFMCLAWEQGWSILLYKNFIHIDLRAYYTNSKQIILDMDGK